MASESLGREFRSPDGEPGSRSTLRQDVATVLPSSLDPSTRPHRSGADGPTCRSCPRPGTTEDGGVQIQAEKSVGERAR